MHTNYNSNLLDLFATWHRSRGVGRSLSDVLDEVDPEEYFAYTTGLLTAQANRDEERAALAFGEAELPASHEGHYDVEQSRDFWRGVFEQKGYMALIGQRRVMKKVDVTMYKYPQFKMACSYLLLSRMFSWYRNYSGYPMVADADFQRQIDDDGTGLDIYARLAEADKPGGRFVPPPPQTHSKVAFTGLKAQLAIKALYQGATLGDQLARAKEIMAWKPITGTWSVDTARRPVDLTKLKPIPEDLFK